MANGPDDNQNLIIRVLLFLFVAMFCANTIAQFIGVTYKEPIYMLTLTVPMMATIVYAFYKGKSK